MSKSEKKTGKDFEQLVYNIYKELEPHADVRWNDFIEGNDSKISRQIDISIRSEVAGHKILIIIQAKDQKRPADVNIVGEFSDVIKDVGAQKGILICNSGFTTAAKNSALNKKIDICSAHDASKINWQTKIQIPVIKKSISVKLKFQHTFVPMGEVSINGINLPDIEDTYNYFLSQWESSNISKEPGLHRIDLDSQILGILNKDVMPLQSYIEYEITNRHHFKYFEPVDYRGIKDYITNNFTPTFLKFKEPIPFLDDGTWKYIKDPNEISVNAVHLNIEIVYFDLAKSKMMKINLVKP